MLSASLSFAAETLTKSNFAELVIPKFNDFYKASEQVQFSIEIKPKTENDAVKLDERTYEFSTELTSPKIRATINYRNGGSVSYEGGEYLQLAVGTWQYGVESIKVEVSGKVPEVDKRIEEITVLKIGVTDAEKNIFPDLKIKVVNPKLFGNYITSLTQKISELRKRADGLEKAGVSTATAKKYLDIAESYINDGKRFFNNEKYIEANTTLTNAEDNLIQAENELNRIDAMNRLYKVEDKLNKVLDKINEIDAILVELRKTTPTTKYDIKFEEFKDTYKEIKNKKIELAKDYIAQGLFEDAIVIINSANNEVDKLTTDVNNLKKELEGLMPTPTKTAVATPTPNTLDKISSFLRENARKIAIYTGIIVLLIAIGYALSRIIKAYRKRKKWDELK
ncbi:hypothetical protein [Archaeoglobus sulfaticallidus]|nr:hypothetical protein [Archaeoglobus sulfaticallidus]